MVPIICALSVNNQKINNHGVKSHKTNLLAGTKLQSLEKISKFNFVIMFFGRRKKIGYKVQLSEGKQTFEGKTE